MQATKEEARVEPSPSETARTERGPEWVRTFWRWLWSKGNSQSLVMLGIILGIDLLFHVPSYLNVLVAGVLDEVAHVCTIVLILRLVRYPLARSVTLSCLLATVLLDVDHIPDLLGSQILTHGTGRPYTHSVITVIVLLLAAVAFPSGRRPIFVGATCGIVLHLMRDLATGPVAIWWPVSWENVYVPYALYGSLMTACALVGSALWQKLGARLRGRSSGSMQHHVQGAADQ